MLKIHNSARPLRRTVSLLLAALALVLPSSADVLIVDAGGSPGSYPQISAAVEDAQAGDKLLVLPGDYEGFVTRKPLTILGQAGARITGDVLMERTTPGTLAVLANFDVANVRVWFCKGTVVLDQLRCSMPTLFPQRLTAEFSTDVRLSRCVCSSSQRGFLGSNGRIEICSSSITDVYAPVVLLGGVRCHVALTDLRAQDGFSDSSICCCGLFNGMAGNGGNALEADAAEIILTGTSANFFRPGAGGWAAQPICDGFPGLPYINDGGSLRASGAQFLSAFGAPAGPANPVTPADPTLAIVLDGSPGGVSELRVTGPPGGSVRLLLGSGPAIVLDANVAVERLTTEDQVVSLGAIPPSGELFTSVVWDPSSAVGDIRFAQVSVVLPGGDTRRSNSASLIAR